MAVRRAVPPGGLEVPVPSVKFRLSASIVHGRHAREGGLAAWELENFDSSKGL
ncbi:MAG: hypothetical protein V3U98_06660 [Acidobacteriota bacterium]